MPMQRQTFKKDNLAADTSTHGGGGNVTGSAGGINTSNPAGAYAYPLENYTPADFSLPLEELPDGRLSHREQTLLHAQWQRITGARAFLLQDAAAQTRLEETVEQGVTSDAKDTLSKTLHEGKSLNVGLYSTCSQRQRLQRFKHTAAEELHIVHRTVGANFDKIKGLASMQSPEEFGEESTIDFPRLGSLEEKYEDLRQEQIEKFCKAHGKVAAARFQNSDKRMLRKWFRELDIDNSGEVSVAELQDPLLSAGIFLTREQVYRVMLNADKNDTAGLDFEEFLNALYSTSGKRASDEAARAKAAAGGGGAGDDAGGHRIDLRKLKKLQSMGSDQHGFAMETLLSAERRGKLFNSVVNQMEKREGEFRSKHGKWVDSSRKLDSFMREVGSSTRAPSAGAGSGGTGQQASPSSASRMVSQTAQTTGERRAAQLKAREKQRLLANASSAKHGMKWMGVAHETDKKLHQVCACVEV